MAKRLAIVVATHPEDHSVDLVMTDDGSPVTGVQVMTPSGSSRTGNIDLPEVTPSGDKRDITKRNRDQDVIAVVDYIGRIPVVQGFLYPQVSQMTFSDKKTKFYRHQSDVYHVIDGDGNMELYHPGGAYVRIGETPDHVDLSSKNVDKNLSTDRNTGKRVNIRVATGGNTVVLTMTPDGEVSFTCEKDFKIEAQGSISMKAEGDIDVEAAGMINMKAGSSLYTESGGATTIKAPTITNDGNLGVTGSTSVKAITSNGKDISDQHRHKDSMPGPGTTGVVS